MAAVAFWLFQDARGDPLYLLRWRQTSKAGLLCAHLYKVRAHAFERVSLSSGGRVGDTLTETRRCGLRTFFTRFPNKVHGMFRHAIYPAGSACSGSVGIFAVCTFMIFAEQGTVQSGIRTHVRGVWTRCLTT